MKASKFRPFDGPSKFVIYRVNDGVLVYQVPSLKSLFEMTVKDAYTPETWKENGSDSKNYRVQMEKAIKRFIERARIDPDIRSKCTKQELESIDQGKFPDTMTAHHDRTSGKDVRHAIMQIVRKDEHRSKPHKGASAMANPRIRERDYENTCAGQSRLAKLCDIAMYNVIKHKTATSVTAGTIVGSVSAVVAKKRGLSKNKSCFVGLIAGIITGIGSSLLLNSLTKNIYVGD